MTKMKSIVQEYKLLLRNVPSLIVALFTLSVVASNLLANKTIITIDTWFALDGGILISWLSFLCMDIVTKRFGPKASTRLTIVAILVNLLSCLVFFIASRIPSTADDYTAFDSIFGGTWFVLLSSSLACLVSGIVNNFMNDSIGKLFKKDPDGKLAYVSRCYASTFIGQFLDNLVFSVLTFMLFAPIFWDGFSWTFTQCLTCSITGALVELVMEVVFSPIGYKVCKSWDRDGVGDSYIAEVNKVC